MKFLAISSMSLFLSTNVMAGLNNYPDISCKVGKYRVDMSFNVNENPKLPLSIVQVFENNKRIYDQFYKVTYKKEGRLEVWSYTGALHVDGVIGVAATSVNKGKADIFIDMGANGLVDGASVACSIER